ncbi:protein phosphatase 2C domain-containing protein [Halonotius sp. GCM10025705]|uniref:protein phosphatase 2C domain-containing protein n=1 Tax=Halonotius sp. GCM10025705 TaxID=3252678 RepID=UPI00360BCD1A
MAAREAVKKEAESRDETVSDLETTLLVVAADTTGIVGGVVGDGGIVSCKAGSYEAFVPREMSILDIEEQHKTVPLMTENWEESFRCRYQDGVDSIALFSDGIDPWAWDGLDGVKTEYFDKVISFIRAIEDTEEAKKELCAFLDNDHHRKYKADDKTLAVGVFSKTEEPSEPTEDDSIEEADSEDEGSVEKPDTQKDNQNSDEEVEPESGVQEDFQEEIEEDEKEQTAGKKHDQSSKLESEDTENYLSFEGTLVPDEKVVFEFHSEETDVKGKWVAINDSKLKRIDEVGEVEFEIPFADQLEIGVYADSVSNTDPEDSETTCYFHTVIDLNSTINIEVTDERNQNEFLNITLGNADKRVQGADVFIDDEHYGETNESGMIECEVDSEITNPTIRIEKGNIVKKRSVFLEDFNINVSCWPIVLPYRDATVSIVNNNGKPKESVSLYVDGNKVGDTNKSGNISITIPFTFNSRIKAKYDRSETEKTVSPLRNLLIVVVMIAVIIATPLILLTKGQTII